MGRGEVGRRKKEKEGSEWINKEGEKGANYIYSCIERQRVSYTHTHTHSDVPATAILPIPSRSFKSETASLKCPSATVWRSAWPCITAMRRRICGTARARLVSCRKGRGDRREGKC